MRSFSRGFIDGFKLFGETVANIVNFFLMLIAYIVGIGLTSIVARISGKRFLDYKKKDSYWIKRNQGKEKEERYYRLF